MSSNWLASLAATGSVKIAALLRQAGWLISDGRVERVWHREGLKVPLKQPKHGRLWLAEGMEGHYTHFAGCV